MSASPAYRNCPWLRHGAVKPARWPMPLLALALLTACEKSEDRAAPMGSNPELAGADGRPGGPAGFEDVTQSAGMDFQHQLANGKLDNIMKSDGAGGVVFDYDRDGFLDVYLVNSGPVPVLSEAPPGTPRLPNRLFRNRGDGMFEDVTERAGVEGWGFGTTAAAADYDNDGFRDLLVVNFGGLILYRNEGGDHFKDVTAQAGLVSEQPGISATFFDLDNDGYLDLFVANYLKFDPTVQVPEGANVPYPGPLAYEPEFNLLYRNRGDGTFENVSELAGIRIPGHRAMSVTALDYDLDGDSDIYVSNDGTPNLMLQNDGRGRFTEVGLQTGLGFNQFGAAEGSMGAAMGDCTGDGLPDVFVTRFGRASLYVNSPGGLFTDSILTSGILQLTMPYTGWGGNFLDFDNDGDLDLFIANGDPHFLRGMPPLLIENRGNGTFRDGSAWGGKLLSQPLNARGSGAWDYDNDGRMDLILTTLGDRAVLWRNVGQEKHHWLTLELEGTLSNRDGFGARVRVTSGKGTWYAEARCPTSYVFQQDPRPHFGLREASQVERIEIQWPSGQTQILTNVAVDRILKVTEPGTSRWPARS